MNILIIGHARHGKDTTAELLNELYKFTFESSSVAASRIFLYERLAEKYGYGTFQECFEDRVNHRAEWHREISDYNKEDKARLAKAILQTSNMYIGMRSNVEVEECITQGLFDWIIGIYDPRKPEEPKDSFNINIWEKSDFILPNALAIVDLKRRVQKIYPLFNLKLSEHVVQNQSTETGAGNPSVTAE